MTRLVDLVPDADTLLQLAPEELGVYLLRVVRAEMQKPPGSEMCHIQMVMSHLAVPLGGQGAGYEQHRIGEIERAVTEAWSWLEREGYLVPAPDLNGRNGWRLLSRKAAALKDPKTIRAASKFPKELLHPDIAERSWMPIMRGDFDSAVNQAYVAVEQAVRLVGAFAHGDVGVALMRKAFDPEKGPLTDQTRPKSEREAMGHLFAGAFGSIRNPHAHGTATINDVAEAQHLVMLASHLMRIVDTRRPGP